MLFRSLRATAQDRYTLLQTPERRAAIRERDQVEIARSQVYALDDYTVYLTFANFSRATRNFVLDNKDYMAQYQNLVLDLRYNGGGWLADMHRIACLFAPDGVILSIEEAQWRIFTRTATSDGDAFFNFDNIIILQNRRTASAAEGLIMAIQAHAQNVITIGETTFGKGTGQVAIPLTGGYAIQATVLNVMGPDRRSINNIGIPADIEADGDLIALALKMLN